MPNIPCFVLVCCPIQSLVFHAANLPLRARVTQAAKVARTALESSALDHGTDPAAFRKDLINIAKTTLSSKILTTSKQFFAELAVNAVTRLKGKNNLEGIQIIKSLGGALSDSYLDEGFLLQKKVMSLPCAEPL